MADMSPEQIAEIQASVMAGTVMTEIAGKMSGRFDTFGTWLLAGFGAGITLLLEKHDEVSVVPIATIKLSVMLFLISCALIVVEKYLANIVGASADAATFTREAMALHFKNQKDNNIPASFDLVTFKKKLIAGMLPTHRWFAALLIKKADDGDLSRPGNSMLRLAQAQGFLVFIEALLFLRAVFQLMYTLPTG